MKIKRKIIRVDEEKCTGCGQCVNACPEGALQLVDTSDGPKARLVSDFYCDGLGACIGDCPEGALSVVEEEVEPYNETAALENIVKQGSETVREHLLHLKAHNEKEYLKEALGYLKTNGFTEGLEDFDKWLEEKAPPANPYCACPGAAEQAWKSAAAAKEERGVSQPSELTNWPVQMTLLNPLAPYLKGADLLISADCVPFAYADFHRDFMKGKVVIIGCPKLDDLDEYVKKLTQIFETTKPASITIARMEVPCCGGLSYAVRQALENAEADIPVNEMIISIKGAVLA